MIMTIKILNKKEAKAYQQSKTNNITFTQETIDSLMRQDIQRKRIRLAFDREVANAQTLLNLYKEVFELKNNIELFNHIKEQNNFANGLDYDRFQNYLQTIASGFKWGTQGFGTTSLKQYNLSQAYIEISQYLNNKRYQKYNPKISLRNTKNYERQVIQAEHKRAISDRARKNGMMSGKNYKKDFLDDTKKNPDLYTINKRGDRTQIYRHMTATFNIRDKRTLKKYLDEYLATKGCKH